MAVTFPIIILPVTLTDITTFEFTTYKRIHICTPEIVKHDGMKIKNTFLTR